MSGLLQEWVTRQAQQRPEATALVMQGQRLAYGELEAASNRLARLLRDAGCVRGDRVCLLLPKSPAAIVALLGVLKADGIYVPIDPLSPAARAAKILDACENRWVLAAGPVTPLLDELMAEPRFQSALAVGWMEPHPSTPFSGSERGAGGQHTPTPLSDSERGAGGERFRPQFDWEDLQRYSAETPAYANLETDPAHILFTSGSTGTPKGVVITHANVRHFVEWAKAYFGMTSADRISGHPPLQFDMSTFDIFGTFAAGAELHLVPPELNLLPQKLAQFIRAAELTQWFSVPSILNQMAKYDVVRPNDFPALKRLLWAGDVLPTPALIYWMRRLPHVTFTNLYGPTETTISSSYCTVPACPEDEKAAVPIGTACAGEELLVLDEALQPVPRGEPGDLYIRGVGLSPGYWRDAEKTRAAFVPNPHSRSPSADPADRLYKTGDLARLGSDGLVYFLGRRDSQIKHRGYRIELGEIESALNATKRLQECAVVAIPTDGLEGTHICCAYVPVNGDVTPETLRRDLGRLVPKYMTPSRWKQLDHLPHNANGKIDRRRLREVFQSDETANHPTTAD